MRKFIHFFAYSLLLFAIVMPTTLVGQTSRKLDPVEEVIDIKAQAIDML